MYNSYDTDTAMVTKYNALKTKWGAERWGGFPQVRQLQIRRYADTGDNSINFHTLMILSTAGNTSTRINPTAGEILPDPATATGSYNNLLDGSSSTVWQTSSGTYSDTTLYGFNFTWTVDVTVAEIQILTVLGGQLANLRFRLLNSAGTEIWAFDNTSTGTTTSNGGLPTEVRLRLVP